MRIDGYPQCHPVAPPPDEHRALHVPERQRGRGEEAGYNDPQFLEGRQPLIVAVLTIMYLYITF